MFGTVLALGPEKTPVLIRSVATGQTAVAVTNCVASQTRIVADTFAINTSLTRGTSSARFPIHTTVRVRTGTDDQVAVRSAETLLCLTKIIALAGALAAYLSLAARFGRPPAKAVALLIQLTGFLAS